MPDMNELNASEQYQQLTADIRERYARMVELLREFKANPEGWTPEQDAQAQVAARELKQLEAEAEAIEPVAMTQLLANAVDGVNHLNRAARNAAAAAADAWAAVTVLLDELAQFRPEDAARLHRELAVTWLCPDAEVFDLFKCGDYFERMTAAVDAPERGAAYQRYRAALMAATLEALQGSDYAEIAPRLPRNK